MFWDFTDKHLNVSVFAKLVYLPKVYENPTFWRYALHNLYGQTLQIHCFTHLWNWYKQKVSCILVGAIIIAENRNLNILNQNIQFFIFLFQTLQKFCELRSENVNGSSPFKHRFHNQRSKTIFCFVDFNQQSECFYYVFIYFYFFNTLFTVQ